MNEVLVHGDHTFEVVNFIPYGYRIWNIGKNMKEDYLPLVVVGGYDGCQVVGIMKAMPLKNAQKVLRVIGGGCNTPLKMQAYIEKYKNKNLEGVEPSKEALEIVLDVNEKAVEMMEEALEILLKVEGAQNLNAICR